MAWVFFGTEFWTVIGLKLVLFRVCEGWMVYGVVWPIVSLEM